MGRRGSGSALDLSLVDTDGSQSITLEEFTALMKGELISSDPLEGVWAAFSTLSRGEVAAPGEWLGGAGAEWGDGSGVITLDGLRRAVREFDVPMSEEELRFMMAEADRDGGGSIDRDEFMNIVARAPWY